MIYTYVTGAADGLGKAIAQCYAENGMKVIVSDINAEQGLRVDEEIKSGGGEASAAIIGAIVMWKFNNGQSDIVRKIELLFDTTYR